MTMDSIKLRILLKNIVEKNDERSFSVFFDHYHTKLIKLAMFCVPKFGDRILQHTPEQILAE